MPYISCLPGMPGVDNVIVIVPETNIAERSALGWKTDNLLADKRIQIVVAPKIEDIKALFAAYENRDTWCMFLGISAFPPLHAWFKLSLKYNVKRGIITEPPFEYGHPLWQHAVRFFLKDLRYVSRISKIFVMGDRRLGYYRLWSRRWEVIPFMYCTEWRERQAAALPADDENRLRLLYVGSLTARKNVACLLKACMLLSPTERTRLSIGIVGDGEQRAMLETMARSESLRGVDVEFLGTQPMDRIPGIMQQYDALALPSLHDGWGAVGNEALTLGLYFLCSDHCGARMLLNRPGNGCTFKAGDADHLAACLRQTINHIEAIREGINERIAWSRKNISGHAVAQRFLSHLISGPQS